MRHKLSLLQKRPKIRPSSKSLLFTDTTIQSIGRVEIPLATPRGARSIVVSLDVVAADVRALRGLDVLNHNNITADTVLNRLAKREIVHIVGGMIHLVEKWSVHLNASDGHVYTDAEIKEFILIT